MKSAVLLQTRAREDYVEVRGRVAKAVVSDTLAVVKARSEALGERLGEGRTAEVFAWGEDEVVKLFRCEFEARAEDELRLVQAAQVLGDRTPAVKGLVRVCDRAGIVFARARGRSLMSDLSSRPWRLRQAARGLAVLHRRIHEFPAGSTPRLLDQLGELIEAASGLTSAQRRKALWVLDGLPDGETLCHGDMHPGNVMEHEGGLVAIDWGTAGRGDPLVDVGVTALVVQLGELPSGTPWWLRRLVPLLRKRLREDYLSAYGVSKEERVRLNGWQVALAAARLGRNVAAERTTLLEMLNAAW